MDFLDDTMRDQTRVVTSPRRSFTQTATFPWLVVLIILTGLLIAFSPVVSVSAGHRGVATVFGDVQGDIYSQGVHLKYPLIRVHQFDIRTQVQDISNGVVTKDMQLVTVGVTLTHHLDSAKLKDLYETVGQDVVAAVMEPAVKDVLNTVVAQFTAEDLVTKRDEVNQHLDTALNDKFRDSGVIIDSASLTNLDFSDTLQQAFEARVIAEESLNTAKLKAQANTTAAVAQAQLDKSEAERIRTVGEALKGYEAYIQYEILQKWDGTSPLYLAPTVPVQVNTSKK